jgi:hypothetical protein
LLPPPWPGPTWLPPVRFGWETVIKGDPWLSPAEELDRHCELPYGVVRNCCSKSWCRS